MIRDTCVALALADAIGHRCYNAPMEIVNYPQGYGQIGASGECPHCGVRSLFQPVMGGYTEVGGGIRRMCNPAQCQACKGFVLVLGTHSSHQNNIPYAFEALYPLGKPNDSVDETVPKHVAADFAEALRCCWVNAYKATVTMCRRAIQSSVLDLGASDKKLVEQIDELASKGKLTNSLRDYAHEVRLTGNDGAHPDKDELKDVSETDAGDIIAFTRHFFDHVYVTPARLAARKPKPGQPAAHP